MLEKSSSELSACQLTACSAWPPSRAPICHGGVRARARHQDKKHWSLSHCTTRPTAFKAGRRTLLRRAPPRASSGMSRLISVKL
eukprot:4991320-Prymnesium_polylepis.1